MNSRIKIIAARLLPTSVRRKILRSTRWPPVNWVDFGNLRRLKPISRVWGGDRGLPIDRYYIEQFLSHYAQDIHGDVLEVADDGYTRRFGGGRVTKSDVLHLSKSEPPVTIVADLTCANDIPSDTFNCIILTQTLQFIYDVRAALETVYRILKPGGIALVTIPCISKVSLYDTTRWGHYWNFTIQSAKLLFEESFPAATMDFQAHGNVLVAMSLLHGLACEELRKEELDHFDPEYPIVITIRAMKPPAARIISESGRDSLMQNRKKFVEWASEQANGSMSTSGPSR